MNSRPGRLALRLGVGLAVLLLADQVARFTLLSDGMFLGRPVAPFDPPLFSPAQVERLERIERALSTGDPPPDSLRFDEDLGWCNPSGGGFGEFRYSDHGCRIGTTEHPAEKRAGIHRAIAVGCSMTHGDEVGASETWCAQADAMLDGWEVCNLGVAAFGVDQALLRLQRDGAALAPDEVWLGLLPSAVLRITNLYRPALRHWSHDVAMKPRFRLGAEGDGLTLVPSPARTLADIPRLLRDQHAFVTALREHDDWVRRFPAAYAPRGSHWSHWLFTTRVFLSLREVGGRTHEELYRDPDHEGFRLLRGIVLGCHKAAADVGARFRLLVFPGIPDLAQARRDGFAYWEALVRDLERRGVTVLDLQEDLLQAPPETIFAPLGHYNAEGSHRVAKALARALAAE